MAYPMPFAYDDDKIEQRDMDYMKSMYPEIPKKILPYVEEECDRQEYDNSMIYDEYPDKYMFYHLCSKIKESMKPEIKAQAEQSCFLDELVHVLLGQEICRRRCRRKRCRGTFYHW